MKKSTKARGITIQVWNTRELPQRSKRVAQSLSAYESVFATLYGDENFITLLEAESLTMIPDLLKEIFHEAKIRNGIA